MSDYKGFLKYIKENYVDKYGKLLVIDGEEDDEFGSCAESVAHEYLNIEAERRSAIHEERMKSIENYFLSDKANRYFDKIKREEERAERWVESVKDYILTLTDEEFDEEMMKFIKWETKYEDYWYDVKYTQTTSILFSCFASVFEELGIEVDKDSDFYSSGYEYRGYTLELYQGQGCFYKILKDGEVIFQTT
jgi:hypothetical protein